MDSQVSSQVDASGTQLALTWVGWPNGEKFALTNVQI